MNNRVFRIDGRYFIVDSIFGEKPRLLQAENLDKRLETIYQVQTAQDCLNTFAGMVDKGMFPHVIGRTHFNAVDGKLIIELEAVKEQEEQPKEEVKEEKTEKKIKKNKKESK